MRKHPSESPAPHQPPYRVFRLLKEGIPDPVGTKIADHAKKVLHVDTGRVGCAKLFLVYAPISPSQLEEFAANGLRDAILHDIIINDIPKPESAMAFITVARFPGVTDDEGLSAQAVMEDLLELEPHLDQRVFSQDIYWFERPLDAKALTNIAHELLGNPLIHHFEYGSGIPETVFDPRVSIRADSDTLPEIHPSVDLTGDDEALLRVSRERLLSLNAAEMRAIARHFEDAGVLAERQALGLPTHSTECELEILAQTWSEHCKHKEFSAIIQYRDLETGQSLTIDSLFNTFIKAATRRIQLDLRKIGDDWLVKVFSDNAGAVKIDDDRLFIWKVETHNSPSALDPYGGAITGILGNNRDPLGTGIGGARLLFNTNVLCFAPPDFAGELYPGQLHPRKILSGVCRGIEDGGNKSGIPTVNGSIVFDDRFRGKPLVFCGTGAVMPAFYKGRPSWEKEIAPGDLIVMAGGRVGKDGIHGATFSSAEIDEKSPHSAVQIGSPIIQKRLADFLQAACREGLVKCCTDNGAGGLSSSIGELATISGGAFVDLGGIPLKYAGLKPWEIFLSESQERMSLVIEPRYEAELFDLARLHEVELSVIGRFTGDGFLDVRYDDRRIARLSMEFLHHGVPRKSLVAEWKRPELSAPAIPQNPDYGQILLSLLGSPNIRSRESIIRRYDHEVKGLTVIKPLMGRSGIAPQDAAIMRFDHDSFQGIAISNGIIPRYGDIDPYEMSAGSFDEAVRQIISVGGRLPGSSGIRNGFWSVNDNFCVPDSVFDETMNPDGKLKLAKLVQMCQALYDMSVFFGIPMTSGKDSMKNDFRWKSVKISVPPTVLYSMAAKVEDVRKTVTSDFKAVGDLVYQVGETFDETGASEFLRLFGQLGDRVPRVRKETAKQRYLAMSYAIARGLVESCHDLSDGGLAVGLAESAIGSGLGADIALPALPLPLTSVLFAESHSRFVVTVRSGNRDAFERLLGPDAIFLGSVTSGGNLHVRAASKAVLNLPLAALTEAWIAEGSLE